MNKTQINNHLVPLRRQGSTQKVGSLPPQGHLPSFFYEDQYQGHVVGIDEVGRGPLVGPVVAAAVCFITRPPIDLTCIQDSKKLSATQRAKAFALFKPYVKYAVASASAKEIDGINILQASLLAMQRAVYKLDFAPDFALVDGNKAPQLMCPTRTIVKGDSKSLSIAAASIIAKITRDHLMNRLALRYPVYAWEKNAGYPTLAHRQAIEAYGITKHHRQSFGRKEGREGVADDQ